MENLSRRKLLASAGVATGAAAIAAAPAVAQAALDHPEATDPSGPPPEETIGTADGITWRCGIAIR